jgi:RNA polymerase sigma-70 factor (TIGR02960 family)
LPNNLAAFLRFATLRNVPDKIDETEFERLVAPHRTELHAHCYRMLGSVSDADDALQDALLGAWRGFAGFEGRSSLRSWLFRITTNACFGLLAARPRRQLATEYQAATPPERALEPFVEGPLWLEPYPEDPQATFEVRESVELAFVAALQHLPATQRATLILREVVGLSAVEVAALLDTSVPSIDSALQRARKAVAERVPPRSQQATLRDLGEAAERELVARYVGAWESANPAALLELLAQDVKFSMPPIPNWFDGRDEVGRFFAERVFATPWRLRPMRASGQLAFACYQGPDFRLGALNVVTLRGGGAAGQIAELTGFLDPALYVRFRLPER